MLNSGQRPLIQFWRLCVCSSFCPSVYLSIYVSSSFCPSVNLSSIHLFILLSVCSSFCPSVHPSVHSIYLSVYVCLSFCPSVHPSVLCSGWHLEVREMWLVDCTCAICYICKTQKLEVGRRGKGSGKKEGKSRQVDINL